MEKKIIDYEVLEYENKKKFLKKIKEMLLANWQPYGNLYFDNAYFTQAMVKYEEHNIIGKDDNIEFVIDTSITLLREKIERFISNGWRKMGSSVVITAKKGVHDLITIQAMIKIPNKVGG